MSGLNIERFLNLVRLLDVISREPILQMAYVRAMGYPDVCAGMLEFFEDVSGYESFVFDLVEFGHFTQEQESLYRQLNRMSDTISADPRLGTREEILNGREWRAFRDVAMLLRLSISPEVCVRLMRAATEPGFGDQI